MSIGVKGVFKFEFSTGGEKEFLTEEDLQTFTLIEEAGNVLPIFEIVFVTHNVKVLQRINEGNEITISLGSDNVDVDNTTIDGSYIITRSIVTRSGKLKYLIQLFGIFSALPYISIGRKRILPNKLSIDAIKEVIEPSFGKNVKIDVVTKDIQNWIQYSIPDKKFINELWMHSHISTSSFMLIGISAGGTFIARDMAKVKSAEPAFNFTTNVVSSNDINYEGDYVLESKSGFLNHWLGYGKQKHIYNQELGTEEDILEDPANLVSITGKLSRSSLIPNRIDQARSTNENVHKNYWKAYLRNIQGLATFSNIQLTLSFSNRFIGLKVLDLVQFKDVEINAMESSNEQSEGIYFVSKIVRTISQRQLITTVQMVRESFNDIRGDLR